MFNTYDIMLISHLHLTQSPAKADGKVMKGLKDCYYKFPKQFPAIYHIHFFFSIKSLHCELTVELREYYEHMHTIDWLIL